jgi:hypothetical protein
MFAAVRFAFAVTITVVVTILVFAVTPFAILLLPATIALKPPKRNQDSEVRHFNWVSFVIIVAAIAMIVVLAVHLWPEIALTASKAPISASHL